MRSRLTVVLSCLVAVGCAPPDADIEVGVLTGTDAAAVRDFLEAVRAQRGAPPSISVAVAADGQVVLAKAVGFADLRAQVAATPRTTYRAYSISKAITAVAVLQQVAEGRLRLDDDIRTYVPGYPAKPWPITLHHLLTHTSGIRHYKPNAGEISSRVEYDSLDASLDVFEDDPLEFEPGTARLYSSFGYNLLTGAVEAAAGTGFGDYLARRVFGPAGMEDTHLAVAGRTDPALALGYAPGNRVVKQLPNVSGRYGSSGIVTTPTDLVRLALALESDRLLERAGVERMLTVDDPTLSEHQALGWSVTRDDAGRRLVYATGGGMGYTGLLFHYPDQRVAGALLVNQAEFDERVALLEALLAPWLARGE